MKKIYDDLSFQLSKRTTQTYSTSFSLGILALKPSIRNAIYAIYGFVRLADEIVDSFHNYDKKSLLNEFKTDTHRAIESGISLNPILHSFQQTVHQHQIDPVLIDQFLHSMEMDLQMVDFNPELYAEYIFGSAEVVGLMCLQVFSQGDEELYEKLKPYAQKLGSVFQKVNFLRDLQQDYHLLGRTYFPNIEMSVFNDDCKWKIEQEIEKEFEEALEGIKMLPDCARFGVYLAYRYYLSLFRKIRRTTAQSILSKRTRIPNSNKVLITMRTYVKYKMTALS